VKAKTAILDGEIVIVDAHGRSSFQELQRSMGKGITSGFAYEVFDLIYLDGYSLTQAALIKAEGTSQKHYRLRFAWCDPVQRTYTRSRRRILQTGVQARHRGNCLEGRRFDLRFHAHTELAQGQV